MTTITVSAPTIVGLAAMPAPRRLIACPSRARAALTLADEEVHQQAGVAHLLRPRRRARVDADVGGGGLGAVVRRRRRRRLGCGVGSVCSGGAASPPSLPWSCGCCGVVCWSVSAARARSARRRCRSRGRRTASRARGARAAGACAARRRACPWPSLVGRRRRQEVRDAAGLRRRDVVVAVGDQQEGAQVVADRVEAVERAGRRGRRTAGGCGSRRARRAT